MNKKFCNNGDDSIMLQFMVIDIDEAAVSFEARTHSTVNQTSAQTVLIWAFGSNKRKLKACAAVACDGKNYFWLYFSTVSRTEELEYVRKIYYQTSFLVPVWRKNGQKKDIWVNGQRGFGTRTTADLASQFYYSTL